jgi:protein RecA
MQERLVMAALKKKTIRPHKLPTMGKKGTYAERVAARMQKVFGDDKVMLANSERVRGKVRDVIPSPLAVLNEDLFQCGGAPVGRIGEVFGVPGVGKSSLGLGWLAECQKMGGLACLSEVERQLDIEVRAPAFGLDTSQLLWWQPESIEDVMEQFETLALARAEEDPTTRPPCMFIWDTLAATPTQREINEGLQGKAATAERARIMSNSLRLVPGYAERGGIAVVFINQVRSKIGDMFGRDTQSVGGNAIKFHAAWRLELMGGTAVKQGTRHIGKDPILWLLKHKDGTPLRKERVRLLYESGWDDVYSTVLYGKEHKLLDSGARATVENALIVAEAAGWDIAYDFYKEAADAKLAAKPKPKRKAKPKVAADEADAV